MLSQLGLVFNQPASCKSLPDLGSRNCQTNPTQTIPALT